jgi:uncharacterized damage-inducible protein DinB
VCTPKAVRKICADTAPLASRERRYHAAMALKDSLLPELDHEFAGTRKTLERVPEDKLSWSPHGKSWALGDLATHLSQLPHWLAMTLATEELDLSPPGSPAPKPQPRRTKAELLSAFDEHVAAGRAALLKADDSALLAPWSLKKGGTTLFTLPRIAALRSFVFSHNIHHRAQLGVYLRLLDVPVPALYGPSADEGRF